MTEQTDFTDRFIAPIPIGDGASGAVFKADDPRIGRSVAVKVLHSELMRDKRHSQRFQREVEATATLEHPNIPPVYEVGETSSGRPYMALKLLEGERLQEVIERLEKGDAETHQQFSFTRRISIAMALCDALEYAHERGILHRDIKPENIMLGQHGEVWLVDWGLAAPPSEERGANDIKVTDEYSFVGTLATAAPEQLGGETSAQSDQYSLGVVLYELFALRSPSKGESKFEIMQALLNDVPKPAENFIGKVQGRVPREISVLLVRMLQKKPEDRFTDIREVNQELSIIQGGDIRAICPHTMMKKTGHRLGRLLDTHNLWLAPLVLLWLAYPLVHFIYLIVGALTRGS